MSYDHYKKDVSKLETIDIYRVLDLFGVTDPALQHAAKKILCAGARGAKDREQDVSEAIASLQRWREMREEEQPREPVLLDKVWTGGWTAEKEKAWGLRDGVEAWPVDAAREAQKRADQRYKNERARKALGPWSALSDAELVAHTARQTQTAKNA